MTFELLYDYVTGNYPDFVCLDARNLFREGELCDRLYEEIYAAKLRINKRLGTQEDTDLEQIINNLFTITKIISRHMYECGATHTSLSEHKNTSR